MADPINVANSPAQLDGKTLVTAEDAQEISGQKIFKRAPSAPFDVESGSAVVTNLDADKLDGEEGSAYHNASNLNAGTVPAARLADPLPAKSGENLTNLDAGNLTGTVPGASIPNPLPAGSGANLTNLDADELASGTVPGAGPATKHKTLFRGGTFVQPTGIAADIDIVVWRAPFACTVTALYGKRTGGTSCDANAWRNGSAELLASDAALGTSWASLGTPQNTAFSAGDELQLRIKSPVGSPTQVSIQVDFTVDD